MLDLLRKSEVQIPQPVLGLNRCFTLYLDLRFGFALNGFGNLWRPQAEVLLIPDHGGFGILGPELRMAGVGDPFITAQLETPVGPMTVFAVHPDAPGQVVHARWARDLAQLHAADEV